MSPSFQHNIQPDPYWRGDVRPMNGMTAAYSRRYLEYKDTETNLPSTLASYDVNHESIKAIEGVPCREISQRYIESAKGIGRSLNEQSLLFHICV